MITVGVELLVETNERRSGGRTDTRRRIEGVRLEHNQGVCAGWVTVDLLKYGSLGIAQQVRAGHVGDRRSNRTVGCVLLRESADQTAQTIDTRRQRVSAEETRHGYGR